MIRSLYFTSTGTLKRDLPVEEYTAPLKASDALLWVDFEDTAPDQDEVILRDVFHFHPLAIEDALQQNHVPKVDDWVEYLYIVLHAVAFDNQENMIHTQELDVFLGNNYLVTHHDAAIPALNRVWDMAQRDKRHWSEGIDHLLYKLADEVVASYMPVVEQMDEAIDRAEDEVFDDPTPRTLERIFTLKRATLHLRRILGPQREVLNKLARDSYTVIDGKDRIYFRDVYDHLVRMYDISESIRDLVGGTLDTYLSVINNRMNDIMKTLTVITTLFMPIAFITGFFGMNYFEPFQPVHAFTSKVSLAVVLSIMVGTPLVMFLWIRRRGWM